MKAEIITIGDEILIGQIVDTNSAYIAKELNKIGIAVHQITSVEDEKKHILSTLKEAGKRANIVLITGGLGPTNDDITKHCFSEFFEDKLVLNEQVLQHVEHLFKTYIQHPISELNRKQALLPSRAQVLHNKYGTAPGMWMEQNGVVYISMPGVPFEMKKLMEDEVLPKIQQRFERPYILHRTLLTYGIGESAIAEKIEDWENALPKFIKLAYLPSLGRVRLRLSAVGKDESFLKEEIEKHLQKLHQLIGDSITGYEGDAPIELQIGNLLRKLGKTLATAESFTGGRISSFFTKHAGSSSYFKGGTVTYATASKENVLGISKEIIDNYSVVSAEVAEEMAKKVKALFESDYAIATTGNAGPSKGDSAAELGSVFIGLATPEKVVSFQFSFGQPREKVVGKALSKSMELLLKELQKSSRAVVEKEKVEDR